MAGKASGIEKDLECPICLDIFRNARYLSCLHTFCAECIEDLSDGGKIVSCPECRQTTFLNRGTGGAEGLKPNIVVNRLMDTLSKKKKSKEESSVSGDRKKSHDVGSEDGDQQVCRRHAPCVLKYFCKECREPICSECVMETHILHVGEVCTEASLIDEKKGEMRARLEESKIKLGEQRGLIKNLDAKYQQGIKILGQAAGYWKSSLVEHFAQLVDCKREFNAIVGQRKQSQERLEARRVGINELGWDLVEKADAKEINATYQQWLDALKTISDESDMGLGAWEQPQALMEELADECLDNLRRLTLLVTELKQPVAAGPVESASSSSSTQSVPESAPTDAAATNGAVAAATNGAVAASTSNGTGHISDSETNPRLNNIRLSGIPEIVGEDTTKLIVGLVKGRLGIDLAESDIDWSHRVGAPHPPSPGFKQNRSRPILARLRCREKKRLIMWETIKLKDSGISLYEDLPQEVYALKSEVYRHEKVVSAWTVDGTIYATVVEGDGSTVRKCIPNREALALL